MKRCNPSVAGCGTTFDISFNLKLKMDDDG
jgi:hypothetical protein